MLATPRMRRLVALPIASAAALAMVFTTGHSASAATTTTAAKSATSSKLSTLTAKQVAAKKKMRAKHRRAARIVSASRVAARQKGDPYRYGASGPGAFDCSGLTSYSFRKAGMKLPRTANSQYHRVRKIKKSNIRKGDLVFFGGSRKYHVGIYWGKGRILHAPYSGSRVKVERIWTRGWSAGTLRLRG
ncbi:MULTISPECIES: C40 family peptidase [Mumia]|uniref:C40 family peptidase n=2 Tax=Mumia TaxID=1546255 RepID=A0ABW1QLL6_9ACTN|nr:MULTISPECIES: C40 family peptidase [Mumia]